MKNIYKIAASLVATALILVACTVPVEQEEEIGYMIRGLTPESPEAGKGKIANLSGINLDEVQFIPVLHEVIYKDGSSSEAEELTEVVLLLPEANHQAAIQKVEALTSIVDFSQIDIMPIEETVERTLFESAINKTFDIKINPDLSDDKVASRINAFLHENSSITETIEIKKDDEGNRHAVFVFEMGTEGEFEVKRDIEELYQDLTPGRNEFVLEEMNEEEMQRIRELEQKKMKEAKEEFEDQ